MSSQGPVIPTTSEATPAPIPSTSEATPVPPTSSAAPPTSAPPTSNGPTSAAPTTPPTSPSQNPTSNAGQSNAPGSSSATPGSSSNPAPGSSAAQSSGAASSAQSGTQSGSGVVTSSAIVSSLANGQNTTIYVTQTDGNSTLSGSSGHHGKSNTGAIAGGVIGGVVGLALILGVAYLLIRRHKRKQEVAFDEKFFDPHSSMRHSQADQLDHFEATGEDAHVDPYVYSSQHPAATSPAIGADGISYDHTGHTGYEYPPTSSHGDHLAYDAYGGVDNSGYAGDATGYHGANYEGYPSQMAMPNASDYAGQYAGYGNDSPYAAAGVAGVAGAGAGAAAAAYGAHGQQQQPESFLSPGAIAKAHEAGEFRSDSPAASSRFSRPPSSQFDEYHDAASHLDHGSQQASELGHNVTEIPPNYNSIPRQE